MSVRSRPMSRSRSSSLAATCGPLLLPQLELLAVALIETGEVAAHLLELAARGLDALDHRERFFLVRPDLGLDGVDLFEQRAVLARRGDAADLLLILAELEVGVGDGGLGGASLALVDLDLLFEAAHGLDRRAVLIVNLPHRIGKVFELFACGVRLFERKLQLNQRVKLSRHG